MGNINTLVRKYLNEKDREGVKEALSGLAYFGDADSFQEFKNSTEYAINNMNDLFDVDDGQNIDKDYSITGYKKVVKMMMKNFSEKKYEAVIDIGLEVFVQNQSSVKTEDEVRKEEKKEKPLGVTLRSLMHTPMLFIIAIIMVVAFIVWIAN